MKRWATRCAAGACVAGLIAGVPGTAAAGQVDVTEAEQVVWSESGNMNIALYGPPSMFVDPIDVPVQVLYGPPSMFERAPNPMVVKVKKATVRSARLAIGKKKLPKAISVESAAGTVRYSKIAGGSSKKLVVDKSSGVVTVKKGTKKGLYRMQVVVSATGDDQYSAASETVTVKVRVK